MKQILTEELMVESMSRHCAFYKASNGKWYMELAAEEYGDQEDADTYGPFSSEEAAMQYLENFSNPGSFWTDDSGTAPPPTASPNGRKVISPSTSRYGSMRGYGRYGF